MVKTIHWMKKKYTRIRGMRVAYKCEMNAEVRYRIMEAISLGWTGGCVGKNGWWIKAKYSV